VHTEDLFCIWSVTAPNHSAINKRKSKADIGEVWGQTVVNWNFRLTMNLFSASCGIILQHCIWITVTWLFHSLVFTVVILSKIVNTLSAETSRLKRVSNAANSHPNQFDCDWSDMKCTPAARTCLRVFCFSRCGRSWERLITESGHLRVTYVSRMRETSSLQW
jgi:hypothetical protein